MRWSEGGWRVVVVALLAVLGLQQVGSAGMIRAKATLAQYLIADAWQKTQEEGGQHRPWPWADTWPVARLLAPVEEVDLYVLAGTSGEALAFGPGLETAAAMPGGAGASVIAGHRDTHFGFLRLLDRDSPLELQVADGRTLSYRVIGAEVIDASRQQIDLDLALPGELQLVTCYPFDALRAGGALRYVVRAIPMEVQRL
ncbi:MAG: class GN sortase [Pseudomonadota bacterium]